MFGFGSVVTILIAIIGVGVGLWRNADKAHETIGQNISRLGIKVDGLTEKVNDLRVEVKANSTDIAWIKNKLGGPAT